MGDYYFTKRILSRCSSTEHKTDHYIKVPRDMVHICNRQAGRPTEKMMTTIQQQPPQHFIRYTCCFLDDIHDAEYRNAFYVLDEIYFLVLEIDHAVNGIYGIHAFHTVFPYRISTYVVFSLAFVFYFIFGVHMLHA